MTGSDMKDIFLPYIFILLLCGIYILISKQKTVYVPVVPQPSIKYQPWHYVPPPQQLEPPRYSVPDFETYIASDLWKWSDLDKLYKSNI